MLRAGITVLLLCLAGAQAQGKGQVGMYLLGGPDGLTKLETLAKAGAVPITRVYLAFARPTLVYKEGQNSLDNVGFDGFSDASSKDKGFSRLKTAISTLKSNGVETFISMGGWNYNCFPALYMRYSVAGYGTDTPNYWKIQKFGGGSVDGCTAKNEWCYVCEPPSENATFANFEIFPEPNSTSFSEAMQFVDKYVPQGNPKPKWDTDMVPSMPWTNPKTGETLIVPGTGDFAKQNRDPYADLVFLAKDLQIAGVDLDYEEMWHADFNKVGSDPGPWTLPQTIYKYAAIVRDIQTNIAKTYPTCKMSTAASAVGAWSSNWWGGNLKGVWYFLNQWMPALVDFMSKGTNAGGINVMTYDLSRNEAFHECPDPTDCTLDKQVRFYMKTYNDANIVAGTGFEIGTPAYPDPSHDHKDQLPLTRPMLKTVVSENIQSGGAGFVWEMYKPTVEGACEASPTDTAQSICKAVLGASSPQCAKSLPGSHPSTKPCPPSPTPPSPPPGPTPPSPPPPGPPPPPPPPHKTCHAVPGSGATDQWCDENCNHMPPECPANLCKCT